MKKQDLQFLKETLEYALNDCPVKDGDHQTHFNTFANAISLVDEALTIDNVSQQRELLNGFAEWLKNDDDHNLINKYTVDAYLESI